MERHPDVELLRSESLFEGRIFDLLAESVRLPSGLRQDLTVVAHGGAVAVAPRLADGRLLVVHQYRHAVGDWLLEIPAGRLEANEDPLEAARRELEEETGHRARRWEPLRTFFPAPGFCSERMTLYLAEELEAIPGGGKASDDDEEIEVLALEPAAVIERTRDAKTLIAALLLCGANAQR
jgi:ADP-ribose pyrophosphatase